MFNAKCCPLGKQKIWIHLVSHVSTLKNNPIQRFWQIFCPKSLLFELNMKRLGTFYLGKTMHCLLILSCVYTHENHKKAVLSKLTAICYCLHGLNDDVIFEGYNSKYSSGLCKVRFYQYHLLSFQITYIIYLKTNISLISTHR